MQVNLQARLAFRYFVRYKILGLAGESSADEGIKFKKFALTRIKSIKRNCGKLERK